MRCGRAGEIPAEELFGDWAQWARPVAGAGPVGEEESSPLEPRGTW